MESKGQETKNEAERKGGVGKTDLWNDDATKPTSGQTGQPTAPINTSGKDGNMPYAIHPSTRETEKGVEK
jgi:hypothetical protein